MSSAIHPVTISQDVVYSEGPGYRLTGDFYRPQHEAPVSVTIAIHGGAWRQGDQSRYRHIGAWLAARGVGVFAITYRLATAQTPTFPAAVMDVIAAIRFLIVNAGEMGIDPQRIALMGDSAGGHLAATTALAGQLWDDQAAPDIRETIRAVIPVYGVYDMVAQWEHDLVARPRDSITATFLGLTPLEDRMAFQLASPINHATLNQPHMPFMVVWGTDDDIVDCTSQSERFALALKQAGFPTTVVPVLGAPHFWIDEPVTEPTSFTAFLLPRVLRFLNRFV